MCEREREWECVEERAGEGEGVCVRESGSGSVWKREREWECVEERAGEGVCGRESKEAYNVEVI